MHGSKVLSGKTVRFKAEVHKHQVAYKRTVKHKNNIFFDSDTRYSG